MYSPGPCYPVSNTMTRRKQNRTKSSSQVKALENRLNNLAIKAKRPKKKKSTPFGDVGSTVGRSIGGMFGSSSIGQGVGRWLGTGIGSIFGSGDYQITGGTPGYNVIANGNQIPKFSTGRQTNIVCHREYLGDYAGTAGFNNNTFALNPGISSTFPWLSSVAGNYQEYKFHGLVFEFRSLITDFVATGAPGVVVMSTNYNADAPVYTTKQQMENAEYAVSVKPTVNLLHGVECAENQTILAEKYVRTGAVPAGQDLRLYDLGTFQFATQANPVQNLGELWVSYCVEFFKPILSSDVGGSVNAFHYARTGSTTGSPFGTGTALSSGTLSTTITPTVLTVTAGQPQQLYMVQMNFNLSVAAALTMPTLTFAGCATVSVWNNDLSPLVSAPPAATVTSNGAIQVLVRCTLLNPGAFTITASAGIIPAASTMDLIVNEYDPIAII